MEKPNDYSYHDIVNDDKYRAYIQSDKWKAIARKRMEIDNYTCQGCGSRGTASNPIECHHLTYRHIYHEENYIYQDLVSVCHCCHKTTHNIMVRITDASGRRGWKNNCTIPQINVFTTSGELLEVKEGNRR